MKNKEQSQVKKELAKEFFLLLLDTRQYLKEKQLLTVKNTHNYGKQSQVN